MEESSLIRFCKNQTEGILIVDTAGKILSADYAVEKVFGCDKGELAGKYAGDFLPDNEKSKGGAIVKAYKLISGDEGIKAGCFETAGLTKDKKELSLEVYISEKEYEGIDGILCFVADVSSLQIGEELENVENIMIGSVLLNSVASDFIPEACKGISDVFGFSSVSVGLKNDKDIFETYSSLKNESGNELEKAFDKIQSGKETYSDSKGKKAFETFIPLISSEKIVGIIKAVSVFDVNSKKIKILEAFSKRLATALAVSKSQKQMEIQNAAMLSAANSIIITDADGNIEWVNRAFSDLSGYDADYAIGKNPSIMKSGAQNSADYENLWETVSGGEIWRGELINRHRNGSLYTVNLTITPVFDNDVITNYVAVQEDLTAYKNAEGYILHLSNYDQLTGLPNRGLFLDRLRHVVSRAKRKHDTVAVLFVDLTNFNRINDTLGHSVGDKLLKIMAERITELVAPEDIVARIGGDEFAVICRSVRKADEAAILARRLIGTILKTTRLEGNEINVGAYVGISIFPDDGYDADRLVNFADMALHKAVKSAPNSYFFFSKEMNTETEDRLVLERDLRKAIENDEFILHYQPQIDLRSGALIGWEALIRWLHPERGMVPPGRFIPIAEDTGLIVHLGEWVIKAALEQWQEWKKMKLPETTVAVNLSAVQFQRDDLALNIEKQLIRTKVPPENLELELTETVIMQDAKQAENILSQLSEIGCQLAIDDFGTGYSSLNYLKRFPVDRLKIDQSFVRDMTSDYDDAEIARAIINLGHSLGMEVVSEGVESEAQLNLLREQGCDVVQGFLFGRPMPTDQVVEFMRNYEIPFEL